ncbi:MAG: V-type ATP synthase subunit E [Sedimentibacter sp.]|uniref:V-type ATP synthase subunit E n=1 Tax=Sedimentibacter sp. TaxID=1960295 RepID=UPI002981BBDE|nr:V-type ATP synthase subunit E [Sedimentibacter sp.]MDW5299742.1 V-type ATP synthase subunit E [Sedimentibacter sp.]
MSIDNITLSILDDAKNIAESSLVNAEKTKQDIIKNAMNEAEAIKKTIAEEAIIEAENLKNRKISAAELQKRKMLLSAKQESIKKGFEAALTKLKTMPEERYLSYLADEIAKIPNCEGIIILNETDRERIGEKLVKAVNEKLKAEKISLSKNTVQASGGFVLKNGNIEINSTFETILDSMKDELTNEVANALFK